MYKVLFVDDEEHIRSMLLEYFGERYDVGAACNAAAALEIMERKSFHLVVSDISMPGMSAADFLREVKRLYPKTKRALFTSLNIDEYIALARQNSISSVIPKTVPFNFKEMEPVLEGLLTGEVFGVSRYLNYGESASLGGYCVKSSVESPVVRDKVISGFQSRFGDTCDMGLILDEILANAVYHAPVKQATEAQKNDRFAEVRLKPSEYVYVNTGYDGEKYGVSVLDTQGRLTRDMVLGKMERHISGDGLLDGSGRGFHMSRLFTDRMVVNIERNKRTEIILMNYYDSKYRGYKPLYINEI